MIKKIYRLKEREVKKVLRNSKPFFSYGLVLNARQNKKSFNRFAIIIGAKSVKDNISRNFFRRRFYDFILNSSLYGKFEEKNYDFIFVVKKKTKLDKKDKNNFDSFIKDLKFLERKFNG